MDVGGLFDVSTFVILLESALSFTFMGDGKELWIASGEGAVGQPKNN